MADGKDEKDLKNNETEEKAESGDEQVVEPDSTVKNDEPGPKKAQVAVEKAEADSSPSKAKGPSKLAELNPTLTSFLTKRESEEETNQNLPAQASSSKTLPAQTSSPKLRRLLSGESEVEKNEDLPAQPSADQQSDSEALSVSPTKRAAKREDGSDDEPTQPKQLKSPERKLKD